MENLYYSSVSFCSVSKLVTLVQDKIERGCCEVICGVPMTLQGYGID